MYRVPVRRRKAPTEAVVVLGGLPGHKQVVARAAHGQGQMDGVHRAGLAEGRIAVGQVGGGVEVERGWVAAGGKLGRLQRAGRWACGVQGVGVSQGQEPSRHPLQQRPGSLDGQPLGGRRGLLGQGQLQHACPLYPSDAADE